MAYAKVRPRRGTLAEWTLVNPVIAEGELVIEHPNTGVGTGPVRFKIGDGFKPYNDLPYAFDALASNAIYGGNAYDWHDIIIRSDSYDNWMSENPILSLAEISYDMTHKKIKVGDGVTPWSELSYIGPDFNHGDYDFGDENQIKEDLNNGIPPKEPTPASVVYRPRRGTLSTMINPDIILRNGEMFFEIPEKGIGKGFCKVKIGDGITPYSQLPYSIDPSNCDVRDLPNEILVFNDTLTNDDIDPLLAKIKSNSKLSQIIENIRASLVWLKTNYNTLKQSYDAFVLNVSTNYLSKDDASNKYLSKNDASNNYLNKNEARYFVTLTGNEAISNKTYNGYTLSDACEAGISDTTKAKQFANSDGDNLITERRAYFGTPQFNGFHNYDSNTKYFVHTSMKDSMATGEDIGYGSFISVSGGTSDTSHPIWKNPKDIFVGAANKAKYDWDGKTFEEKYVTSEKVSEIVTNGIPNIEEEVKKLLPPTSILTPLSFHRAVFTTRGTVVGEDGNSYLKDCWFKLKIPNTQIPYVNLNQVDTKTDYTKINRLSGASELNNSCLLLITVASNIQNKSTANGYDQLQNYRADLLMWAPRICYGKYPTVDGRYVSPVRKNIFSTGYNAYMPWGIRWAKAYNSSLNFPSDLSSRIPDDIVYREANVYINNRNTYRDVTVYVFRLDAGPKIMTHIDMDSSKLTIDPVGNMFRK